MNKKQIKKLAKKIAKNKNKTLPVQAEFSNASPARGAAYARVGSVYGW